MLTPTVPPLTEQLTTLLTIFGLTTAAEEIVPRLTQAGHPELVPLLVEVLTPRPKPDASAELRGCAGPRGCRRGRRSRRSTRDDCRCRSCSGCRSWRPGRFWRQ